MDKYDRRLMIMIILGVVLFGIALYLLLQHLG